MPLYDAHGNLIKSDQPVPPESIAPQDHIGSDRPPTLEDAPIHRPVSTIARILPVWARGWKLGLEIGTLVGLVITFYALRPILSATSSVGTGIDGIYGVKITVAEAGISMKDVLVQCVSNKVIFDNRFTLQLNKFVSVDEYSVGDVSAGESFTVNCTFAWSMWDKTDGQGMLILGRPTVGRPNLGMTFQYVNGVPMATSRCPIAITVGFADAVRYKNHEITGVDGSFVIRYRWPLLPFHQTKIIHMIESLGPENGIKWKVAPASEPVMPDAQRIDGWKMTAASNAAQFAITMKGGKYTQP
jgi:hypothetical protein